MQCGYNYKEGMWSNFAYLNGSTKLIDYDIKPSYDDDNINPDWIYKPVIEKFDSPKKLDNVEYRFGIVEKTTLCYGRYISEDDFSVIELTYSYNDIIYHYEGDEIINSPIIPLVLFLFTNFPLLK